MGFRKGGLYEAFKSRRCYLATLGLINVRNLTMERRVPAPAALGLPWNSAGGLLKHTTLQITVQIARFGVIRLDHL